MLYSKEVDQSGLVRYGILGLGIGMAHVTAAASSDKCLLCAVADIDPARRENFLSEYPDVPAYETLEEMLAAEKLDAVSICLPRECTQITPSAQWRREFTCSLKSPST